MVMVMAGRSLTEVLLLVVVAAPNRMAAVAAAVMALMYASLGMMPRNGTAAKAALAHLAAAAKQRVVTTKVALPRAGAALAGPRANATTTAIATAIAAVHPAAEVHQQRTELEAGWRPQLSA